MAWTTTDLDTIKTAIARGVLRVRYSDGSQIDYASMADLLKAKAVIEGELASVAAGGRNGVRRFSFAGFRPAQ